jgi:hypothetical protein
MTNCLIPCSAKMHLSNIWNLIMCSRSEILGDGLPHLMQHPNMAAMAAAAAEFLHHGYVKSEVKHEPSDLSFALSHFPPSHHFELPLNSNAL